MCNLAELFELASELPHLLQIGDKKTLDFEYTDAYQLGYLFQLLQEALFSPSAESRLTTSHNLQSALKSQKNGFFNLKVQTLTISGLTPFFPIPETLAGLIAFAWRNLCWFGMKKPLEPAVCLLTGRVIGMDQDCRSFKPNFFNLNIPRARTRVTREREGLEGSNAPGMIGECAAYAGLVGAGQGIYLLPYSASLLVVASDGVCSMWDSHFPYVDDNGESTKACKRVLGMKLDRRKLEGLRQLYTLGGVHAEIVRQQSRTLRYIPVAL